MISIEAARDGFNLNFNGRVLIAHSARLPCIKLGQAENILKRRRGSFRLKLKRQSWSPLRSFKVVENGPEYAVIDFDGLLRMAIQSESGRLRFSFTRSDGNDGILRLRLVAPVDERIFGCGARTGRLDLKGLRASLWVTESPSISDGAHPGMAEVAKGRGLRGDASPYPVPAFVSTKNYWCAIDTTAHVLLDFSRKDRCVIESWTLPREIVIGGAPTASGIAGELSNEYGRQPRLPEWCFDGASIEFPDGLSRSGERLESLLSAGVKLSSVILGDLRVGGLENGSPRRDAVAAAISFGRERGFRVLGRTDPFLSPEAPDFSESVAQGFCVRNSSGEPYLVSGGGGPAAPSHVAMVDLTNPAAWTWLKSKLRTELLDAGIRGWIADSGETLPVDAVLFSGKNAWIAHNEWPRLWARLNSEAIAESPRKDEAIFLMRSGWLGSGRYAHGVALGNGMGGSARGVAEGVVASILSLGLSGIGVCHAAIGPFEGPNGLKPIWHSMELAAFSPFFRLEAGCLETALSTGNETAFLSAFARMSGIFAALKPYHVAVSEETRRDGLPSMRHPYLHYESEPELRARADQYLYGRDLLVAPAMGGGGEITELFLPDDEWVHLWSSRLFRGGPVAIESPLGFPAVFYRASSDFAPLFDALRRTMRRGA